MGTHLTQSSEGLYVGGHMPLEAVFPELLSKASGPNIKGFIHSALSTKYKTDPRPGPQLHSSSARAARPESWHPPWASGLEHGAAGTQQRLVNVSAAAAAQGRENK